MNQINSSRERMLAAIQCQQPDYTPVSFMIFAALEHGCKDQFEFVDRQLEYGMDAVVNVGDLTSRMERRVEQHVWQEMLNGDRAPLLHKEYTTPAGRLRTVVRRTEDWPHGEDIPMFDDYLIPRAEEYLIKNHRELDSLTYLLASPESDDIREFRERADLLKQFAGKRNVMTTGGWGVGMDAASWLCGIEPLMFAAIDEPGFIDHLADAIGKWNQERMSIVLDTGVDLYIRRGWYECTDFWSPAGFRRFILPSLRREAGIAHQAGAMFGYIMTTGTMPLLDLLLESDIDVLIGVDPVQGRGTDMAEMKRRIGSRICLWGGVNGFITVERGTPEEVTGAVSTAMETLATGGGFILSPVDNVRDDSPHTWGNVDTLMRTWSSLVGADR